MGTEQDKSKARRPPYASETDLDAFFGRIPTVADPGKVDTSWVKSYGWAKAQPEAIVSVLKWLRIIDNDGASLKVWDEIRVAATRKPKLEELVRAAYEGVFSRVDVEQASAQDLHGAFVQAYQSGDPRRHITCFLALCKHAGIVTKAATEPVVRSAAKPVAPKTVAPRPAKKKETRQTQRGEDPGASAKQPVTISVNVEIPANWTEDQIRERLDAVRRATEGPGGRTDGS